MCGMSVPHVIISLIELIHVEKIILRRLYASPEYKLFLSIGRISALNPKET